MARQRNPLYDAPLQFAWRPVLMQQAPTPQAREHYVLDDMPLQIARRSAHTRPQPPQVQEFLLGDVPVAIRKRTTESDNAI